MAPKRPHPNPPSASSSEDEERDLKSDVKESPIKEENDDYEERDLQSDSGEGSESESDSDKSQPSPNASDFTIKLIEKLTTPKKSATPTKQNNLDSATLKKKPAEVKEPKKLTNECEENGKKEKRYKHMWGEEDELAVLKAMIGYQLTKGANPNAYIDYHDFIRKSIGFFVSNNQLSRRIKMLQEKHTNCLLKCDGEKDFNHIITEPRERVFFEHSRKIWGVGDGPPPSGGIHTSHNLRRKKRRLTLNGEINEIKMEDVNTLKGNTEGHDQGEFLSKYPRLSESLQMKNTSYLSISGSLQDFMSKKLSLIGDEKAKELEDKWRNLKISQFELYLKRLDFIEEQIKLVLMAMKSS